MASRFFRCAAALCVSACGGAAAAVVVSEEAAMAMFKILDKDGSGSVTFAETLAELDVQSDDVFSTVWPSTS